jgi:hypothetical protein
MFQCSWPDGRPEARETACQQGGFGARRVPASTEGGVDLGSRSTMYPFTALTESSNRLRARGRATLQAEGPVGLTSEVTQARRMTRAPFP